MAATAVFATVELLEGILLHLEFHDLVRATGVCKTFATTIANSRQLQEALFLRPACPTLFIGSRPSTGSDSADASNVDSPHLFTSTTRQAQDVQVVKLDPALCTEKEKVRDLGTLLEPIQLDHEEDPFDSRITGAVNCQLWPDYGALAAISGDPSRWLNMFTTQPRSKKVEVTIYCALHLRVTTADGNRRGRRWRHYVERVERADGVRLVHLVEIVERAKAQILKDAQSEVQRGPPASSLQARFHTAGLNELAITHGVWESSRLVQKAEEGSDTAKEPRGGGLTFGYGPLEDTCCEKRRRRKGFTTPWEEIDLRGVSEMESGRSKS